MFCFTNRNKSFTKQTYMVTFNFYIEVLFFLLQMEMVFLYFFTCACFKLSTASMCIRNIRNGLTHCFEKTYSYIIVKRWELLFFYQTDLNR